MRISRVDQLELLGAGVATTPGALPPLFRWPGGKRWLVPHLRRLVPRRFGRYYEPFFGGGALFFALQPPRAVLSDRNEELMTAYMAVRDEPLAVAEAIQALPRGEAAYYRIRGTVPEGRVDRAARLIYLTTLAFNGIYRVNLRGQFNVPYGGREYPHLGDRVRLGQYSVALQSAMLSAGDFEDVVSAAQAGDLVYLDPPYTVRHSNNGFRKYNDHIFSWDDQERLAAAAERLRAAGCHVIVSNAYHSTLRELYPAFHADVISRTSVMAADDSRRGPVHEYIFTTLEPRRAL